MRNYKYEYELRKARERQLNTKIDRDKAERFAKHLKNKGITFNSWLINHIDDELKDPN